MLMVKYLKNSEKHREENKLTSGSPPSTVEKLRATFWSFLCKQAHALDMYIQLR